MSELDGNLIDWMVYAETRAALGDNFVRILGYFREDGAKSVTNIEEAMRANDAAQLVMPAHILKGEACQFGATQLTEAAEEIEVVARKCVEQHAHPDELLELIIRLRPMFEQTISALDTASSPVVQRSPIDVPTRGPVGFGRRAGSAPARSFGRLIS